MRCDCCCLLCSLLALATELSIFVAILRFSSVAIIGEEQTIVTLGTPQDYHKDEQICHQNQQTKTITSHSHELCYMLDLLLFLRFGINSIRGIFE